MYLPCHRYPTKKKERIVGAKGRVTRKEYMHVTNSTSIQPNDRFHDHLPVSLITELQYQAKKQSNKQTGKYVEEQNRKVTTMKPFAMKDFEGFRSGAEATKDFLFVFTALFLRNLLYTQETHGDTVKQQ